MVPMNLNDSTVVTVLFMMVSVCVGGGSPKVHNHLDSFECVELQVVKTVRQPAP